MGSPCLYFNEISPYYREEYAKGEEAENRFGCEYDFDMLVPEPSKINIGDNIYLREVYVCKAKAHGFQKQNDVPRIDGVNLRVTVENYNKIKYYISQITKKKRKENPNYELTGGDLTRYILSEEDMDVPYIQLIEFKNMSKETKADHIYQLTGYADSLEAIYGIKRKQMTLLLIGGNLDAYATIQLKAKKKAKYNIHHKLYKELLER